MMVDDVEKIQQRVSFAIGKNRDNKDSQLIYVKQCATEAYLAFGKKLKLSGFIPKRIFVNGELALDIDEITVAKGVKLPVVMVKNIGKYDVSIEAERNAKEIQRANSS